jgi:hypothetical protein
MSNPYTAAALLVLAGRVISVKEFKDNVSCHLNVVAANDKVIKETVVDLRMKQDQYKALVAKGFGQHAKITVPVQKVLAWQEKDGNGNPCDKTLAARRGPDGQPIAGTERRIHRLQNPSIRDIRVITGVSEMTLEVETDEKKIQMNSGLAQVAGETAYAMQEERAARQAEREAEKAAAAEFTEVSVG